MKKIAIIALLILSGTMTQLEAVSQSLPSQSEYYWYKVYEDGRRVFFRECRNNEKVVWVEASYSTTSGAWGNTRKEDRYLLRKNFETGEEKEQVAVARGVIIISPSDFLLPLEVKEFLSKAIKDLLEKKQSDNDSEFLPDPDQHSPYHSSWLK